MRFLMELPTGTGKTDIPGLYLKRLFCAGRAERVLFLVDREQLARQAIDAIQEPAQRLQPLLAQVVLFTGRDVCCIPEGACHWSWRTLAVRWAAAIPPPPRGRGH